VSTDSGTVIGDGEISVWGGKSDASALGGVLRRMTMGMRGLGVTSGGWSDGVVSAEVDIEVPTVDFATLSCALVVRSGSQRVAAKPAKKRRGTTSALTAPTASGPNW
jgi:hypothetical protein